MRSTESTSLKSRFRRFLLSNRIWILGIVHLVLFSAIYTFAFALRFDLKIPDTYRVRFFVTLPVIVGIKIIIFGIGGQLHGWWRMVSFRDLIGIARACLICFLVLLAADYFSHNVRIPRSVLISDMLLSLLVIGGLRSSWRVFDEVLRPVWRPDQYQATALVGIDTETIFLAGQIQSHGRLPLRVVGLISVNPISKKQKNQTAGGFQVLGALDHLEQIATYHNLSKVLVHTELLPGKVMRELMDQCKKTDIELQIVPKFEQRMDGTKTIPTRSINIEDLLRREPAELDLGDIRDLITGKTVLVTGAGGSIGSEICRQVHRFNPERLVLLGRGENRIFHIDNELNRLGRQTIQETVIADIRDRERIDEVFDRYKPAVVFHAAAHKHVPLMEKNVREAVINNVLGTKSVVDAADRHGCSKFVLISSDKSVRPSSVMGATKRVAEMYVSAISCRSKTQFMSVRFGNVLGSAGSVVPLFKQQIERGGPITVTDERMTRFFMTIPEASQLVIQAASMGTGGDLFVLDMGSPVKIVDLARDLIRLSGLPENAIDIVFSGTRPGEKLYEELADDEGDIHATKHPKILSVERLPCDETAVENLIAFLTSPEADVEEIRSRLLSLGKGSTEYLQGAASSLASRAQMAQETS